MRLRNIQGARDTIADSPLVIHEPEKAKGNWKEIFGNGNPVRIEIGMGKGKFIHELAVKNHDVNYVG
ncbi:MAG: tRNA (guanosine(46)-N7)-methyltransferase TrmB, partial [Lachnospiraceae bacterium]|nr:tRNA (guanosine(46)-N7)-methyltransferase TrmB [Lachnospiraceae bacterium]